MMPPTLVELIALIEANSVLRDNWVSSSDSVTNEVNYQVHQRQWHDWVATADTTWLPSLIALTHNPPIAPGDDYLRDTWAMDLAQIFAAIARTQPLLVVETLADALDADGGPKAVIVAFRSVGEAIRALLDAPENRSSKNKSLHNIVAALSPLVDGLNGKSDDYVIDLIDALGEGVRQPTQELLHRIAANMPQERTEVRRELSLYWKPTSA